MAQIVTLDTLRSIPTPEATDTWQPVRHTTVRSELLRALDRGGFGVTDEKIVAEKDGSIAYGVLSLNVETPSGTWTPEALYFNAHDKSKAVTFGAGERVAACTNGCVWAETIVKSRRTRNILPRISRIADEFVGGLRAEIVANEERREAYAREIVGPEFARCIAVRIAEAGVVPSSLVLPVCAEFDAPSFEYEHAPNSLLGLQSAVTHALKKYSPAGQHDRSLKLTAVLDGYARDLQTA